MSHRSRQETIGARFDEERRAASPLPEHPFDACLREERKVDKYQTVAFDNNRYSVPRRWAFQSVTVKGYVDRIEVVAGDGVAIARHRRCYATGQQLLDPRHYLATLGRKPACWDHAPVFRDWQLPGVFDRLREQLEARHGGSAGSRQFVRVLQLLALHPVPRIAAAIDTTLARDGPQVDLIVSRVERLAANPCDAPTDADAGIPAVHVPRPDLSRFDQFLSSGVAHEDHHRTVVAEEQPEAATAADDACRV